MEKYLAEKSGYMRFLSACIVLFALLAGFAAEANAEVQKRPAIQGYAFNIYLSPSPEVIGRIFCETDTYWGGTGTGIAIKFAAAVPRSPTPGSKLPPPIDVYCLNTLSTQSPPPKLGPWTFNWGVTCPAGSSLAYDTNQLPYCIGAVDKPPCDCPSSKYGNPIDLATKEKTQQETDFSLNKLQFSRYYSSRKLLPNQAEGMPGGWRHTYSKRVYGNMVADYKGPELYQSYSNQGFLPMIGIPSFSQSFTYITRPDGYTVYFLSEDSGNTWKADSDVNYKLSLTSKDSNGYALGWRLTTPQEDVEIYDDNGRLQSIEFHGGGKVSLVYSDLSTPADIAPKADLLLKVTDSFDRSLRFQYDSAGRLIMMIDPAGQVYEYAYDANNNLVTLTYPDGLRRLYHYNEPQYQPATGSGYANLITGISDELSPGQIVRHAIYKYDSTGLPLSTELAGGANKYGFDMTYRKVTDPLGTQRAIGYFNVNGVNLQGSVSQPDASGGFATASYDANGNVVSRTDFNGAKTTFSYDLARNLEIRRVEGVGTADARTISTEWHPTLRKITGLAEPKRITRTTYDDKGNVLTKSVQATSDLSGAQGFSAATAGAVRTWAYTYNAAGQVLTATGPRGDTTTYEYDNQGNLISIRNPLGHLTTLSSYDDNGQPGRITDPNGTVTYLTYSPRGWITSRSVAGETTRYDYDGQGHLLNVTLPDATTIKYTYDDAYRLTAVSDSLGNSINYTLDAAGNRIKEEVRDFTGNLATQTTRVYNSLSRLVQLSQATDPATLTPSDPTSPVTPPTNALSPTATMLTATPTALNEAQNITLTATVSGAAPKGPVTFWDGDATLGAASLSNGIATFIPERLKNGIHMLTATYDGDVANKPSISAPVTVEVKPSQGALTWLIPSPIVPGMTQALRAQINTNPPRPQGISEQPLTAGGATGTNGAFGTVTYKDGAAVIGQEKVLCNLVLGSSSGCWATLTTTIPASGAHLLTAEYSGTVGYLPAKTTTYSLLPQITTITLDGKATAGATYSVLLFDPVSTLAANFTYMTKVGDQTLADVATNFATTINASSDKFTAQASGNTVAIAGPTTVSYQVTTGIPSGGSILASLYQKAALPQEGTRATYDLILDRTNKVDTGAAAISVQFKNAAGEVRTASYSFAHWEPNYVTLPSYVVDQLCIQLAAQDARFGCTSEAGHETPLIAGPVGENDWSMTASLEQTPNATYPGNYFMYFDKLKEAQPTILTPQAQAVDFSLGGEPVPGAVYSVVLDGVSHNYTASSGATTNTAIAIGLTAAVAQNPSYTAVVVTQNGASRVRVTHVTPNQPFAYSASVNSYGSTITHAITQQARNGLD